MLPNTHKPVGAELEAVRLHALTLASTEAVISLSVSGVRDEEKETRTGSQLRAKGRRARMGETPVKKERSRSGGGDMNLMSSGRNCAKKRARNLVSGSRQEEPRVEFIPEDLAGLKNKAHWTKAPF